MGIAESTSTGSARTRAQHWVRRGGGLVVLPDLDPRPVWPASERSPGDRYGDSEGRRAAWRERLCRALNVTAAAVGLIALAPLMLLIAALVKITSPGPVIYKQDRVGLDRRQRGSSGDLDLRRKKDLGGQIFQIYKFRTMYVDSDPEEQVWASKHDPRVTPVGRLLRSYRLDELPQLWNVLKGDMNIVGPRPEQPAIFQSLREELDGYQARQRVRPGITGWAQVNLHYDQTLEDVSRKLDFDLEYIRQRSPSADLKIMARTMPVMIFRQGAM